MARYGAQSKIGGVFATNDVDVFERACLAGQVNCIAGINLVGAKYKIHQPLGLGMKFCVHPLGIGIAKIQLDKLNMLNIRRGVHVAAVEAGLADIPGLRPVKVYNGTERAGFYRFPVRYSTAELQGPSCKDYCEALHALGLKVSIAPYPNLHPLPLFAEGFDIFTRDRGPLCVSKDYTGYKHGDLPKAEKAEMNTPFLPLFGDPLPKAAGIILETLRNAANRAGEFVHVSTQ